MADSAAFCSECGAALGSDKSGRSLYGQFLSYRDFEQILLSLGASGSDVCRLWPGEDRPAAEVRNLLLRNHDA